LSSHRVLPNDGQGGVGGHCVCCLGETARSAERKQRLPSWKPLGKLVNRIRNWRFHSQSAQKRKGKGQKYDFKQPQSFSEVRVRLLQSEGLNH
jgi:hypothetical protein